MLRPSQVCGRCFHVAVEQFQLKQDAVAFCSHPQADILRQHTCPGLTIPPDYGVSSVTPAGELQESMQYRVLPPQPLHYIGNCTPHLDYVGQYECFSMSNQEA